jgi:tyrosinase
MLDPISSPGDPMFYVHHAFIDKLWWDWQSFDLSNRLYAIGGPNAKDANRPAPVPGGMVAPRKRTARQSLTRSVASFGDGKNSTTLDHRISLLGLLPDVVAEEVMDIRNQMLCYTYI